jgi:hypothetical protein
MPAGALDNEYLGEGLPLAFTLYSYSTFTVAWVMGVEVITGISLTFSIDLPCDLVSSAYVGAGKPGALTS